MKTNLKTIILITLLFLCAVCIKNNVYAASATISAPSQVYVGEKITVRVTGNAASWSGLTLSASGPVSGNGGTMADSTASGENENVTMGTYTFTATSVGSVTFSLTGIVVNEDYTSSNVSTSKTVNIVNKEETTTTPNQAPSNTTKKDTTSTKKTTETKKEEPKKEDDFYISALTLKGTKENGEQIDISLSPEFKKDVYEYTAEITADIKKIEVQKDAGNYTNSVIVKGLEELKEGENIITLQLSAEDHKAKIYTIKVIKEAQVEETEELDTVETIADIQEENNTPMISMPVGSFILIQIVIIFVELIIFSLIIYKISSNRKQKPIGKYSK